MAKVVWTDPALNDLHSIIEHIAKDSVVYAERFGMRVVQAPRIPQQSPLLGRVVPEFNDQSIRELIYGSYRIIYKVTDQNCSLVAVIHGSRDILTHRNVDAPVALLYAEYYKGENRWATWTFVGSSGSAIFKKRLGSWRVRWC